MFKGKAFEFVERDIAQIRTIGISVMYTRNHIFLVEGTFYYSDKIVQAIRMTIRHLSIQLVRTKEPV
jgi:hypothetical protein